MIGMFMDEGMRPWYVRIMTQSSITSGSFKIKKIVFKRKIYY